MVLEVAIFVSLELKIDEVDASIDRRIARSVLFGVFIGKLEEYVFRILCYYCLFSTKCSFCLWNLCALSHAKSLDEWEPCTTREHSRNFGYVSAYKGLSCWLKINWKFVYIQISLFRRISSIYKMIQINEQTQNTLSITYFKNNNKS